MLAEESGTSGHAVELYSKALRSVIDEGAPITSVRKMQSVKYIGPKITKVLVVHT